MSKQTLAILLTVALAGCGGTIPAPTSTPISVTGVTASTASAPTVPMATPTQVKALEGCKTVAKILPGITQLKPYMTPAEQQDTGLSLQGIAGLCITTNPPANGNQMLTQLFGQLTIIATNVALQQKGVTKP